MKKLTIALLLVAPLSACTTERVIERVQATNAPVTTTVSHTEDEYLSGLTADFPAEVAYLGKVKTVELGHLMCKSIDEGVTVNDLVNMATVYDVDAGFIGSVVRNAVHNLCPENQWFIDSALNA